MKTEQKTELFRKELIIIRTDTDPREVHTVRKYILDNEGKENIWCNTWYGHHVIGQDCEWYQPISQPEAEASKTAEEKINVFVEEFKTHFSGNNHYLSGVNDAAYSMYRKLAEYRNQSIPDVSDQEIEKGAIDLYNSGMALIDESPINYTHKQVCLHETQGFSAGAKWYKNQIKK